MFYNVSWGAVLKLDSIAWTNRYRYPCYNE